MNARQKAKKLKKENERLKKLLDPHTDTSMITKIQKSPVHPEILKAKIVLQPHMPEEMIRNTIAMSIGRSLMADGFLYMRKENNDILNQTELSVRLIAARWPL